MHTLSPDLAQAIACVCAVSDFTAADGELFACSSVGRVLLVLLCNAAAKRSAAAGYHDLERILYSIKTPLLAWALSDTPLEWWSEPHAYGRAIVAILVETGDPCVGQLSFHVAGDEPCLQRLLAEAPLANGRQWNGIIKQARAFEIARWWLEYQRAGAPG